MKGRINETNRDKGIYFSVALAPTQTPVYSGQRCLTVQHIHTWNHSLPKIPIQMQRGKKCIGLDQGPIEFRQEEELVTKRLRHGS